MNTVWHPAKHVQCYSALQISPCHLEQHLFFINALKILKNLSSKQMQLVC